MPEEYASLTQPLKSRLFVMLKIALKIEVADETLQKSM